MIKENGVTLITNGTLIDGTGVSPVTDACVIVKDGLIDYAGVARDAPDLAEEVRRIDANGGTIMPGLVEAHFHATYFNIRTLEDLDIKYPVEYVSMLASAGLTEIVVEPTHQVGNGLYAATVKAQLPS